MPTAIIYVLVIVVAGGVLFGIGAVAFGRGEELAPLSADDSPTWLPADRPIATADVRSLRLPVGLRGYRMSDVDWVLERLGDAIEERDEEIARLGGRPQVAASAGSERADDEAMTADGPDPDADWTQSAKADRTDG